MVEKRIIVDGLTLQYEGLFVMKDLYDVIEHWQKEKGYDKQETKNFEQVLKTGRDIKIETWPTKALSDYARVKMKILIFVKEMKDVIVKKENQDIKMNHAKITIEFNGYLFTDWAGRWEGKPIFYFLRQVFDRWVYGVNTAKYENAVSGEVNQLYTVVKGYLNLQRY